MCVDNSMTKQCEYCGNDMKVVLRQKVYAKKWNKFCSKSCAAKVREFSIKENKQKKIVEKNWPKVIKKYTNQVDLPSKLPSSINENFIIKCRVHGDIVTTIGKLLNSQRKSGLACGPCAMQIIPVIDGKKQCTGCKQMLPIESYRNAGKKDDGSIKKEAKCKYCRSKEDKDYLHNRCDKKRRNKVLLEWHNKRREKLGIVKASKFSNIIISNCAICNKLYTNKGKSPKRLTCSNICSTKHRSLIQTGKKPKARLFKTYNCKDCGQEVIAKTANVKCDNCFKIQRKAHKDARRKRLKGNYSELVKAIKVFERDKWHCKLCGCIVQKKNIYAENAAEIDHIVPVSLGGVHTYSNVQTLCRKCNQSKSNQLIGQLTLAL